MLTGLSTPSAGQILWHGQPVTGPCENVSIVFQSFALFPWLTVLENVEAPLRPAASPPPSAATAASKFSTPSASTVSKRPIPKNSPAA